MLRFSPASLILLVLLSGYVVADQSRGKTDFETGVTAFQDGDLERAQQAFEQARAEGLSTPSLYYNLGVVYFRLKQFGKAERVFRLLLSTPHAALAQYNLGLVFLEQGDADNARRRFRLAAAEASPEKVRALALDQLEKLGGRDQQPWAAPPGFAFVSVSGGYSDNIASTPDPQSSKRSGQFADMLASGSYRVGGDPDLDVRLNALAYARRHPSESDLDNSFASIGASWFVQPGPGDLTSTFSLGRSWYDSEIFERQAQLDVIYRLDHCPVAGGLAGLECEFRGLARAIRGGSRYRAYDGSLFRAGLGVMRSVGRWRVSSGYSLEADNRRDLKTEREYYSLSPVRHLLSARVRYQWSQVLGLGLNVDYRLSRYRDDHQLITDGMSMSERRKDRRFRGTLLMNYELTARWQVIAELGLLRNQSSIERYKFNQNKVMVGIEGGF